jgi:hypothetical protein
MSTVARTPGGPPADPTARTVSPPPAGPQPPAGGVAAPAAWQPQDGLDLEGGDERAVFGRMPWQHQPTLLEACDLDGSRLRTDQWVARRLEAPTPARTSRPEAPATPTEITVQQRTETVQRRPMEELSRYAPRNNDSKQTAFEDLFDADKALRAATKREAAAEKGLQEARAGLIKNPDSPVAQASVRRQEAALETARGAREQAETQVGDAEARLRAYLIRVNPGKKDEINALDLGPHPETRTISTVKVGDRTVEARDNTESYATSNREGLVIAGNKQPIAPVVDASNLGPSAKTIVKATSANEGDFSSINGYDKKGVSLGLVQFAGGQAGDLLPQVLQRFKQKDPAGFAAALSAHGIDVSGRPPELVARDGSGQLVSGHAAAVRIGEDPRLAGALSAAGDNIHMKAAQIEVASGILESQRNARLHAGGTTLEVKDIITSEYGNGLLHDRSVHAGAPSVQKKLDEIVQAYARENPAADLDSEPVRAEIEQRFISWVEANDVKRAARIGAQTNHERGSFVP